MVNSNIYFIAGVRLVRLVPFFTWASLNLRLQSLRSPRHKIWKTGSTTAIACLEKEYSLSIKTVFRSSIGASVTKTSSEPTLLPALLCLLLCNRTALRLSLNRRTRAITQSSPSSTCCFCSKRKSCIKLTTAALTTVAAPTVLAAAASTATPRSAMTRQLRPQSTRAC